jgi:hypothetical protein
MDKIQKWLLHPLTIGTRGIDRTLIRVVNQAAWGLPLLQCHVQRIQYQGQIGPFAHRPADHPAREQIQK